MVENISSSNSTKVRDQARIKLIAPRFTIGLITDCCKQGGFRDVLKLSQ